MLLRDRVNVHEFTGAATPRESLHIRIEFFRPPSGAFPVMVLVRCVARAGVGGPRHPGARPQQERLREQGGKPTLHAVKTLSSNGPT